MLSPTHQNLLSPEGMARARNAIVNRHSWFLHVSRFDLYDSVKQSGILPKNPGKAIDADVGEAVGDPSGRIVCLWPIFTFDATPKRDLEQFTVAISNSDLPGRVGIDWSYDGCWELVDLLTPQGSGVDSSVIFAEVVRRRGCVVSYDPVPLDTVRVWTKSTPLIDPTKWPLISQSAARDVEVFKGALPVQGA